MLRRPAPARLHEAIDRAIRWRLGASGYDTAVDASALPVPPAEFWASTRVGDPHLMRVTAEWRHRHSRELRIEGSSTGPGGHRGAGTVIATVHLCDGAPADAPIILIVHGYAVPIPFWDTLQARALRRDGVHSMLIDLPFHLRRRVPGHPSGDGFFGADPLRTLASVRQSVEDAAALVAWARRAVTPSVGVLGVSLGGLVALLLAAQVELEGAVAVAPFCDPPATFLHYLPRNARRRLGLRGEAGGTWGADRGAAQARLDTMLAPIVPRTMTPLTSPRRITLVRALHDVIVGPQPVADLARAWGTAMWDYPLGHITVMNARGINARLRGQLLESVSVPLERDRSDAPVSSSP